MAQLVDGTDNVFVFAVKPDSVRAAQNQQQVDDMLTESLALQYTQINDFIEELRNNHADSPEIIQYGTLMKHLQGECALHLSALAAAGVLALQKANEQIAEMQEKIDYQQNELDYWSNR